MDRKKCEKEIVREDFLSKRSKLDSEYVKKNSELIEKKILASEDYKRCKRLFIYAALEKEVQTEVIVEAAWRDNKKTAFPLIKGDEMEFYYISGYEQLRKGCMGIMEPDEGLQIAHLKERNPEYNNVDALFNGFDTLVIMPGVAFDEECHRIGYGRGYYDKWLDRELLNIGECDKVKLIALAFEMQIANAIPHDIYDKKPKYIVTEERKIR